MSIDGIEQRNIEIMLEFFNEYTVEYNPNLLTEDLRLGKLRSIYVSNDTELKRLRLLGTLKEGNSTTKVQLAKVGRKQIEKMGEIKFKQTLEKFEYIAIIMQELKIIFDLEAMELIIKTKYSHSDIFSK